MLKLFQRRPSPSAPLLQTLTQPPFLLFHVHRFHTHFQSQSEPEDIYDPPFSPTPTVETLKLKKKKKKKKKNTPGEAKKDDGNSFPLKSDLPFDFRYSYSETNPTVQPIGFREPPRFSPFGPGRLDRKWTGTCAPLDRAPDLAEVARERDAILGESLSEKEVAELVERYRHSDCSRQINLGRGGVTHNMLEDIHNHWKRAEAVRIKVLGVPTLDMDNVCFHLEDKSGGNIIHCHINVLLLYRGRNYDPKSRPVIPLMLWKPYAPIYPKLVKNVVDGLSFEETKEIRNRGLKSPPLMKLINNEDQTAQIGVGANFCTYMAIHAARNGVYVNVVDRVREAFQAEEVVRLDCMHVGASDCKKIGVKLRDLVPCVPILFNDEQIVLWRGKK